MPGVVAPGRLDQPEAAGGDEVLARDARAGVVAGDVEDEGEVPEHEPFERLARAGARAIEQEGLLFGVERTRHGREEGRAHATDGPPPV